MASYKRLNGSAAGLLGTFVSRYNDVDGYWALGVIYSEIDELGLSEVTFRLLDGDVVPNLKCVSLLSVKYHEAVIRLLMADGIDPDEIIRADITVRFGPLTHSRISPAPTTRDQPFSCRVVIADYAGTERARAVEGWCHKHHFSRPTRSARRLAYPYFDENHD
jgi:hypothetical protein